VDLTGRECTYENSFARHTNGLQHLFMAARKEIQFAFDTQSSRCAVVGSSGKLQGKGLGREIDNHGYIVRFNNAPTDGFEADVGTHTSLRVMATTAVNGLFVRHKAGNQSTAPLNTPNLGYPSPTFTPWKVHRQQVGGDDSWCPHHSVLLNTRTYHRRELEQTVDCSRPGVYPKKNRTDPHSYEEDFGYHECLIDWFRDACGEYFPTLAVLGDNTSSLVQQTLTPPGKHFMSGLAGIAVAALLCKSGIDIYSFDTGTEPKSTKYHYYDNKEPRMDLDDPFESQKMLLDLAGREGECLTIR
jgi:hypothetical protein